MLKFNECKLRLIKESDMDLILSWRNSDRIRSVMYTDHIILMDEHKAWFEFVKNDENTLTLLYEYMGVPLGIVNINKIDNIKKECVWGFYIGDENAPRGSGSAMGFIALEYIFNNLSLNTVIGEALAENKSSLNYHKRLGFTRNESCDKFINKGNEKHSVKSFVLLVEKWKVYRKDIASKIFERMLKQV